MLTLPKIVKKPAQYYVAIRSMVKMGEVGTAAMKHLPALEIWMRDRGIAPTGPAFIKYNLINMKKGMELEFGQVIAAKAKGDKQVVAGRLPAGKYAALTYWGPYDDLMQVNAVLIGWAMLMGLKWDATKSRAGDRFASRVEFYPTDPAKEPDTSKWETEVAIKLAK